MTYRQISEMVRRRKPIALKPADTVQAACQKMQTHGIGAVLVTDEKERLLGSSPAGTRCACWLAEARNPTKTALQDVMTRAPDTLAPRKTAVDALRLMQDGGFRHVPIVTETGKLFGIVSRFDSGGI